MLISRVLVGIALTVLAAMIWLDWNFQTPLFYTPISPSDDVSTMLLFKKAIEISLSLGVTSIGVIVLVRKPLVMQRNSWQRGRSAGFWPFGFTRTSFTCSHIRPPCCEAPTNMVEKWISESGP